MELGLAIPTELLSCVVLCIRENDYVTMIEQKRLQSSERGFGDACKLFDWRSGGKGSTRYDDIFLDANINPI